MGFFASMTAGMYQETLDGRRIYQLRSIGPRSRWPAYVVPDDLRHSLEGRLRRVLTVYFLGVIPLSVVVPKHVLGDGTASSPWFWLIPPAIAALLLPVAVRVWVVRGLSRVSIGPGELVPVDRRERELHQLRAMGVPTVAMLVLAGVMLTVVQVVVLVHERYWLAAVGTVMFGAMTVYFVRQLVRLRREP